MEFVETVCDVSSVRDCGGISHRDLSGVLAVYRRIDVFFGAKLFH
jgi:hypothetical protein